MTMTSDITTLDPPVRGETWDLWLDGPHSPAENMAFADALLLTADRRGRPVLRFYEWDRPAVSIGYLQDFEAAPDGGYAVVRRPTGGGVVFHDHDFTYTVVAPAGHWLGRVDRLQSYAWINRAVAVGLGYCAVPAALTQAAIPAGTDRRRMACFTNPTRYDVVADGRKVAGSAQRRTRDGIIHQGSISLAAAGNVARGRLSQELVRAFRDVLCIETVPFQPGPDLAEAADGLVTSRYGCEEWNARR